MRTPPGERLGHEFRYQLAAGCLTPDDVVIDAACGSGYGAAILEARGSIFYYGIDRDLTDLECVETKTRRFIEADLQTWRPEFGFDVFIGFETIEHLDDYANYVTLAKRAQHIILLSTPIVPTTHENQYHLHDFEPGDLARLIEDDTWGCVQTVRQPAEVAEICLFMRRP